MIQTASVARSFLILMSPNNVLLVDILRACCTSCGTYEPAYLWRVPVTHGESVVPRDITHAQSVTLDSDKHPLRFCLHARTCATVAGTMCNECGVVVNQVHASVDVSHSRPPVCDAPGSNELPGGDGVATNDPAACLQEWRRHTGIINNQPNEVIHSAYRSFRMVYEQQGPISGCKARAVILVSLLYSNRLLYGNNKANEEYLIQQLNIPTRAMNRAFGSLAAVTLVTGAIVIPK